MSAYVFVIILLVIVVIAAIYIIYRVQETRDKRDDNMVKKNKDDMEAEIIKMLRDLVRADEERRRGSTEQNKNGRTYKYKSGEIEYKLTSEVNQ